MGEKLRGITLGSGRKLSGKDERSAEKSFCRRQVGEFMRGGEEGKKELAGGKTRRERNNEP